MELSQIRNFCIIAHIDHGKSTLADRLLELTNTVSKREMKEQVLDQMDLERERGITIKLAPVTMAYQGYELNLIDTPGHVDFAYEVSRSLACVEGAILLVDASQGIQAQTVANLHLAQEQKLKIIPAVNKIDLPNANIKDTKQELATLLHINTSDILEVSGKTGQGVAELLDTVVRDVPAPQGSGADLKALIFDSKYDEWRGVVASVRVFSGQLRAGEKYWLPGGRLGGECLEVGKYQPQLKPTDSVSSGQIGYVVTGLKQIDRVRVGDTIVSDSGGQPLPGYRQVKPMVYAGFYPKEGDDAEDLREALGKLRLNDSSLYFEPEHSPALGYGFRVGFLGLLHLEITQERLEREYNLQLVITSPSVAYIVYSRSGGETTIKSALELPGEEIIKEVREPIMSLDIVTPVAYLGPVMTLAQDARGVWLDTDYLTGANGESERAILHYQIPLAEILYDFYDRLKSASQGYASLNYDFLEYRACTIKRLNILVAEQPVEALASIVYTDQAYTRARQLVTKLKEVLPRQMFEIKIQAALSGKIIASERISAMRKDVLKRASSGGDVTRKRKLLEKQKKGKKRMRQEGQVDIPSEAYLKILSRESKN